MFSYFFLLLLLFMLSEATIHTSSSARIRWMSRTRRQIKRQKCFHRKFSFPEKTKFVHSLWVACVCNDDGGSGAGLFVKCTTWTFLLLLSWVIAEGSRLIRFFIQFKNKENKFKRIETHTNTFTMPAGQRLCIRLWHRAPIWLVCWTLNFSFFLFFIIIIIRTEMCQCQCLYVSCLVFSHCLN